jgi:hypothetical protein
MKKGERTEVRKGRKRSKKEESEIQENDDSHPKVVCYIRNG